MKSIISIATLTLLFLVACANQSALTSLPASRTPGVSAPRTPAITLLPEQTLTATPVSRFTQQCLPVEGGEIALKAVASGTILVAHYDPNLRGSDVSSVRDIQSGSENKLPIGSAYLAISYLQISPNRNMIAQVEQDMNDKLVDTRAVLWVFDARAKVLSKITFDRTSLAQPRWLDSERMLVDTEKYGTLLFVNPFTREQHTIADELPDLYKYFVNGNWWPVVYTPDLEWVAYFSSTGPVVYNLRTKQFLWKKLGGIGDPAVWSPDGQEVAFNTGIDEYQLYIIDRSGRSREVLDKSLPHDVHGFSWSPNGRYIAFWNNDSLLVYDHQMDWVFDTCIASGGGHLAPVWSPDSQQMIVYGYSTPNIPVLVDWQKKVAYKIKEDKPHYETIFGWMNSLP